MLGKSLDLKSLVKPGEEKKVLVIGGGPAGMMAAQTLTAMGHTVKLYEKSDRLGGLLNDATAASFKEYMRLYRNWDIRQTEKCGAEIILNTAVTPELVEQENPDAVIVACGSKYIRPNIPGIDGENVVMLSDVENHRVETGDTVVVCGGGIAGLECAVSLGMEGKKVTVIDKLPLENWAAEMPVFNHIELNYQLNKYGVKCVGGETITGFTSSGVDTESGHYGCDTAVIALGVYPDRTLADTLLAKYPEGVYVVGDCVTGGRVLADANQEAFHAAISIR
jgi:NADPH-dependent 2,4-dienoyl-CoA reductase/sulfur reductase-like enzyme